MKSLSQFVSEALSNAEHEKFMEAVDNYFTILSREADNKREFIKQLQTYSDRQSIKDEWNDFVDAVLANNKELNYKLSYAKIMKNTSSLMEAVVSLANEWIDSWENED